MKSLSKEASILWFIRFAPSIFVILLTALITFYLSTQYSYKLEKEQQEIKNEYINSYKKATKLHIDTANRYINDTIKESKEHLHEQLKHEIDKAYKIVTNIYEKNKNTLSKKEIITHIKNALETIRFNDGNGYFSIHHMDGINILQPINKSLEGTSVLYREDSSGAYPVQKAIEIAKNKGEGFFTWYYYKPNDHSKEYKKFGIAKRFEPYDLIITTAIFEDDFIKSVKKNILEHLKLIRYENDGYIFVFNQNGKVLLTKANRKLMVVKGSIFSKKLKEFIKSNKQEDYLEYLFYDTNSQYSKISFVKKLDNYNWLIGAGFNFDELNALISQNQKILKELYSKNINTLLFSSIGIFIILLFISYFISQYLEKIFHSYKKEILSHELELNANYKQTINSLVELIEQRDFYTAGHSQRVANYAVIIAKAMNFSKKEINILKEISLLHDIGKIAIPDSILLKPSTLTKQEFEIIKEHSKIGYNVLSKIPMFKEFSNIILSHHERYDGSGYPKGLKKDEIPIFASILSIADSFDAMTSTRVYNTTKTVQEALDILKKDSGKLFDEKIINVAIKALKDVDTTASIKMTQLPKTPIEKERFAYFFKDNLTDTFNEDYFELKLKQELHHGKCLNLILIHNFSSYNKRFNWTKGNELIKEIVQQIKESYSFDEIYRFQGTNFILLNKTHNHIDIEILNKKFKDADITFELNHHDIDNFNDFKTLIKSIKNRF